MGHLLNQILVFIGASIIMVPLFHRLGFGSVLGYLIAGVFVGPYGLRLIRDLESVMHFSEFGVVLLLFVIGLEIQPRKLWSMKKDLICLGGLQVAVCTLIFASVGIFLAETVSTSFVLAFGMSLSSTAFAVQSLNAKNNFNTEFGKSSFSILLMQDLLAIPALAIIPGLGNVSGEGHTGNMDLSYLFPVFVVLLVLVSRFVLQPFFRIIAKTHQREIFTATALFVVLGVASIMLKIGLSAALGTFIAGVLLADSEYRHELEANIDPFKSMLLGLFFISVGMTVSLEIIMEQPFTIFGLAFLYLAIKMAVIYGSGRLFKMNHLNSKHMALTIAQGGEFAFVIFSIALSAKLAAPDTIRFLIAIITLSMALNPVISKLDEVITKRNLTLVEPKFDEIKDEHPEVMIAGFGRFGQMFGRVLRAQKIPFVAIDKDEEQIELLRKFGNKVYFGDVMRLDLLESAGIAKAKYFIMAIDDVEISVKAAKIIRERFPHVKIFARARNRGHVFDFFDIGVDRVKRETFDASVNFVKDLLIEMGTTADKAQTIIEKFQMHDEIMLREQYKVRDDDKKFVSISKQAQAQLSHVLNDETTHSYIKLSDSKNET
jgi:monovalent cation:proton antiporter-2 (CPA2) family protein